MNTNNLHSKACGMNTSLFPIVWAGQKYILDSFGRGCHVSTIQYFTSTYITSPHRDLYCQQTMDQWCCKCIQYMHMCTVQALYTCCRLSIVPKKHMRNIIMYASSMFRLFTAGIDVCAFHNYGNYVNLVLLQTLWVYRQISMYVLMKDTHFVVEKTNSKYKNVIRGQGSDCRSSANVA